MQTQPIKNPVKVAPSKLLVHKVPLRLWTNSVDFNSLTKADSSPSALCPESHWLFWLVFFSTLSYFHSLQIFIMNWPRSGQSLSSGRKKIFQVAVNTISITFISFPFAPSFPQFSPHLCSLISAKVKLTLSAIILQLPLLSILTFF